MSAAPTRSPQCRSAHRLAANPAASEVLARLGFDDPHRFAEALAAARPVPGGRAEHRLLALPGSDRWLRLRPARRGGLLGPWLGDRFLTPRRTLRELALWLALDARGIAIPTPMAAIASRRGLFWHCHFAALDRPAARDGRAFLASASAASIRSAASALGRALRRLHDAGVLHGDLQLRNLLVEEDGAATRVLFIDFDRARRRAQVSPRARRAEWLRLARSVEKLGLAARVDPRAHAALIAAYCRGDRGLRRSLLRPSRWARLDRARHRLAWRLSRSLLRGALALLATALLACDLPSTDGVDRAASEDTPRWSLLAVGDTGRDGSPNVLFEGQLAVAHALTREARRRPVDGLVLLGDNFYDSGLSQETLVARVRTNLVRPYCHFLALTGPESSRVADACPIAEADRRPVPLYAVLGNHDLGRPESARLEQRAVPRMVPGWQMSDGLTRVFELAPGISLVLFESEPAIDDRAAIEAALVSAVRAARGPWRILATHRPIATDDLGGVPRGGYPRWVRQALAEAGQPVQLVLAGHHHSLQAFALLEPTALLQIGAGSGSRAEPPLATGHPALLFSQQTLGFARVDLVGEAESERLVVSLYRVPRWPWLEALRGPALAARFEVDRAGRIARAAD